MAEMAGLGRIMDRAHGQPCFVGDAIADPINGLHLALAIQSTLRQGGGVLMDISMRDVLRYAMGEVPENLGQIAKEWQAMADQDNAPFYPMRTSVGQARSLGEDTKCIIAELC